MMNVPPLYWQHTVMCRNTQKHVDVAARCCFIRHVTLMLMEQLTTTVSRRLDVAHVDAIVAEVLQRLDRPMFEAPIYAVDLDDRSQVQYSIHRRHNCRTSSIDAPTQRHPVTML
jgi:hypothetical protein